MRFSDGIDVRFRALVDRAEDFIDALPHRADWDSLVCYVTDTTAEHEQGEAPEAISVVLLPKTTVIMEAQASADPVDERIIAQLSESQGKDHIWILASTAEADIMLVEVQVVPLTTRKPSGLS